jgi:hypothetical protein
MTLDDPRSIGDEHRVGGLMDGVGEPFDKPFGARPVVSSLDHDGKEGDQRQPAHQQGQRQHGHQRPAMIEAAAGPKNQSRDHRSHQDENRPGQKFDDSPRQIDTSHTAGRIVAGTPRCLGTRQRHDE